MFLPLREFKACVKTELLSSEVMIPSNEHTGAAV